MSKYYCLIRDPMNGHYHIEYWPGPKYKLEKIEIIIGVSSNIDQLKKDAIGRIEYKIERWQRNLKEMKSR